MTTRFWTCLARTAVAALLLAPAACASGAARRVQAQPAPAWSGTSIAYPATTVAAPVPTPAPTPRYAARPAPTVRRSGTSQTRSQPPSPPPPRAAAPTADSSSTDTAPFLYRFRAGDEVGVEIWQEKDLSGVQRVLRDGTISPPLLEPMRIEGQTIKEVRARLIGEYREYLKEPRVTVRVASVQSDRMFILGEVKTPKAVPIYGPMTLMQGISEAGGFNEEFANKKTIRIVRQVRGGPSRIISVNAESVLYGRRQDLAMRAGDIVFVHPTGLTNWSRKFSQALDPVAGLLGAAGDAAALVLISR